MMRRGISALALGLFAAAAVFASAPAWAAKYDVKAYLNRKAIDPADVVVLSVAVESEEGVNVQEPTLPPLSDFEVQSKWQGTETSANLVQTPQGIPKFQTVHRRIFNWQLAPKKLGALTIFPIEVVVEGKVHRTSALTVQVASGAGGNRGGGRGGARPPPGFNDEDFPTGDGDEEDLFTQMLRRGLRQMPGQPGPLNPGAPNASRTLPSNSNEAFFIQVETDKTEAYVGEQITVSFYLYTTGLIRDLDTLKYPSLKGFWKEDIEIATHLNFQQEVIDGVPYKKALLASFALFPIKEGNATIDSYQAKCSVISMQDPFGAFGMGRAMTFTKSSQPVKITVKPLPTEGRPADFSGAVGDFQVTTRVEENNIVANQPFSFKIRFEGRGNAKLIDIPPFQPPEGMELYETQNDSKFYAWGTSFKEFSVFLIPRREGDFTIPSVSASIFDPRAKKYVTRSTEPLRLHVGVGAKGGGGSQSFTGIGDSKDSAQPKGPREPKLIETFEPKARWSLTSPSTWTPTQAVVGTIGLFILVLSLLVIVAARELGWGRGKPRLSRLIKKRIQDLEAKAKKGDPRSVGVAGVNLLAFALGEVVGDRLSEREVMKLLSATPPSIQKECGPQIADVLQKFELLAFAPDSVVTDWRDAGKLRSLVTQAEKALDQVVALSGSDSPST